ncbi:MAG: NAD-binding protein [Bacteroidales bacterium]|nr:NAD-binding protein [Bacteroidales bacterium]
MSGKHTVKQKLKYYFDNTLSQGTSAIIMWLAILSLLVIIVFGILYAVSGINMEGEEGMNFFESMWQTLLRSIDPGTMAGDTGWVFRLIGLLITIGGIFILSTLIGVLTTSLDEKLDKLRKGRSLVIEENHTLILGWSPKVIHIISELIIANENQTKPRIVILAEEDKVIMEDEIREQIPDTQNTKIICRTGSPLDLVDLKIVSPDGARSIIIISPEKENADTYVIKSILALTLNPERKEGKYHIVAEVKDEENMEVARIVGKDEAMFVLSPDLTARITAQTCRQSGLSIIYQQLFCYEGDEMYFKNEPSLIGKTYKDAIFSYNNSAVLGYKDKSGKININPPMNTVLKEGDEILAITEDDDTIILSGISDYKIENDAVIKTEAVSSVKKERNVILGWNKRAKIIIRELDEYVEKGSEIHVISNIENSEEIKTELEPILENQKIKFIHGDITRSAELQKNDITSYDNIIILSYYDIDVKEADAKTLICLLHIRNMADKQAKKVSIVSEMFDQKNRELAEVTKADDFIISEDLISLFLTQLSETPDLKKVMDILFEAEGSEFYLKDIKDYVKLDTPVNFYSILEAASYKNETAIGYRIIKNAHSVPDNYGIKVNPDKDKMITFSEGDKIIVLAED